MARPANYLPRLTNLVLSDEVALVLIVGLLSAFTTPECACPAPPERTVTRFTNELSPLLVSHSCIALTPCRLKLGRAPRPKPERPVEQWKAVRPYRSDNLLDSFTMQREIQTVALDFLGHA